MPLHPISYISIYSIKILLFYSLLGKSFGKVIGKKWEKFFFKKKKKKKKKRGRETIKNKMALIP
jgi:hypothetical protein